MKSKTILFAQIKTIKFCIDYTLFITNSYQGGFMKKILQGVLLMAVFGVNLLLLSCDDSDPVTPQIKQYNIYSISGSNGTIAPAGFTEVDQRGTVAYTITPGTGFVLCSLLVDDIPVALASTYTFTNVTSNHSIRAVFAEPVVIPTGDTFIITSTAGANGTISPLGAVKVIKGNSAVFVITPAVGFQACSLLVDAAPVALKDTLIFTNVQVNHTIRAAFKSASEIDTIKSTNINTIASVVAGRRYVVVGKLSLTGELTIQPGSILKFTTGSGITVTSNGSISAVGTATAPIIFTSIKDDAHGGDLNGDAAATTPAPSDWAGFIISSNNAEFQYCYFSYGGQQNSVLKIEDDVTTTVNFCSFIKNNGGLLSGEGALNAAGAGLTSVIKNNVFYGNSLPISISPDFSLDTSNSFSNGDATQPVKNTFQLISIYGNRISTNVTWAETELPFYIKSWLTVEDAACVLNLAPGVVVKIDKNQTLTVNAEATLNAVGTQAAPIYFTSIKDDAVGGDANGDAVQSTPAPTGEWNHLSIHGSKSVVEYCIFSYGGSSANCAVRLEDESSIRLENCTFAYNNGGLLTGEGALDASGTSQTTKIINNRFFGNTLPISIPVYMTLDSSNSFSSVDGTVKNTYNCIALKQNTISVATGWTETDVPFFLNSWLAINNGGVLTLAPGVMIKLNSGSSLDIAADGTLNATGSAVKPIYFTSIKNDSVGGDVNGDGGQSTPSPTGDWKNIDFSDNGSSLKYCVISYGGLSAKYVVSADNATLKVENCTFAYNNGGTLFDKGALNLFATKTGTVVKNNIFYGNTLPLSIDNNLSLDSSNVFFNPANPAEGNAYNGISVSGGSIEVAVAWSETEVPFITTSWMAINDGASLTLGPNVAIKFSPTGKSLTINAGGAFNDAAAGIVLTSYKDDTVKGDSNGDGVATAPAAGDWQGVKDGNGFIDKPNYLYDSMD
jgi:hypothetical protein